MGYSKDKRDKVKSKKTVDKGMIIFCCACVAILIAAIVYSKSSETKEYSSKAVDTGVQGIRTDGLTVETGADLIVSGLNTERPEYLGRVIKLGDYNNIEIESTKLYDTSDEGIDKYIEDYVLPSCGEIVDRPAKDGDTVCMKYTGTIDGVEFEGGSSDDADVKIGSNTFIDGFEDGLIGMSAGDTKVLDLVFPEDYSDSELVGKPVKFEVTVNEVIESKELTDELVKTLNEDCNTVDEYKKYTREQLENYQNQIDEQLVTATYMSYLIEGSDIKCDEAAVEWEIDNLLVNQYKPQAVEEYGSLQKKLDSDGVTYEEFRESIREQAENYVKQILAVDEVAKLENLAGSEDALIALAEENNISLELMKMNYDEDTLKHLAKEIEAEKLIRSNCSVVYNE